MSLSRQEATDLFLVAVEESSTYKTDESCRPEVLEWLAKKTHQGLRREDLLSAEEGAADWDALCDSVVDFYGPALDALAELENKATGSVARPAVTGAVLRAVEIVASMSGTVWCSGVA